jgi:hypothetical protein
MLTNKLSIKTIVGKIDKKSLTEENQDLCMIFGYAREIFTGQHGTFGDYTGFKGAFQGINLKTSERFQAGKLFLPDMASNLLEGELASGNEVEFAFNIGVKADESSSVGYSYTVTPLIKPDKSDPLLQLEAKFSKI